ncbi:hypothetical protein [Clostridium pasteurianum]|uniref:Uncharacterized protein n=1 Tax=Clostridium pasteurianum BC1 TaxID=86416 RepID=R4K7G5_CLOPA|nr:hypothetical protein [Clostridium pasteurianum]AGK97651.1 hypothetical protein Clopa_2813 [Clostridium pasteurianum BC1]
MIEKFKLKLAVLLMKVATKLMQRKIVEHRQAIQEAYADADLDYLDDFYDECNNYNWEKDYQEYLQSQSITQ